MTPPVHTAPARSAAPSRFASSRSSRALTVAVWGAAVAIPVLFLSIFFLWPVIALVGTGLTSPARDGSIALTAAPLVELLQDPRTGQVVRNTLAQAATATVISLILGLPAAYVLYRLRFRGRALLRGLLTVPFVLPTVVVGVAFSALLGPGGALFGLGLDRSFAAVVLGLVFFNVTVVARTVGGLWAQLDMRAVEAARVLGAGPVRAWCTVTLPALLPALASAAALVFLFCATSFGVVLLLGGREFANIETEIYRLTVQFLDLPAAAALSIVQFLVVAVVLALGHRFRQSSAAASGVLPAERRPRRSDAPVIAGFAVTVLLLHALPMISLLLRSLQSSDGAWSLAAYRALVIPPDTSPIRGSILQATAVSIQMALVATLIAVLLGALVVLVLSRRPRSPLLRRGIAVYDAAVMLPLGISAVTLGFGLLLTMHQPFGIGVDLRTSAVLIPIAQALVALPLVVRTLLPVLRSIDPRTREAAVMLGAPPLTVIRTIDLPLLGRSAGLALGFAFAASLGEFGATAFLVRPDVQTLPVAIAALAQHPAPESLSTALAAAVVLGVVTAVIMLGAERLRPATVGGNW